MNKKNALSKKKKNIIIVVAAALVSIGIFAIYSARNSDRSYSSDSEVIANSNFDQLQGSGSKAVLSQIKEVYTTDYSDKISKRIKDLKAKKSYTQDSPLLMHDPYGTDNLSIYVYFKSEEAVKTSYTISVSDDSVEDYSVDAESKYSRTHEFTLIGLVPDAVNTITFTYTKSDGSTSTKTVKYRMGSMLGEADAQLTETEKSEKLNTSADEISDGLYVVLGNDSDKIDCMYYYDKYGNIRGEVPLRGYRSHRVLIDDGLMYYSISQYKIAVVDKLGQVQNVISTGEYILHHDYVFDGDGNLLVLASKEAETYSESENEDIILRIDSKTGKILNRVNMSTLLESYKETCTKTEAQDGSEKGMDWLHLNSIQWTGDDSVIVSSRETSTIIKVSNISTDPEIDYMIGEESFWADTDYSSLLLTKVGNFSNTGGQHSVTYEEDDSLPEGQYYLYMYNNNFGTSPSQPDYDWSQIGGLNTTSNYKMKSAALASAKSYYYKYLVDENAGTYTLVKSFSVPYSSYISSVQDYNGSVIVDSGGQGILGEYDSDGDLLKQYSIKMSNYMIYRVYKYDFDGFYQNIK